MKRFLLTALRVGLYFAIALTTQFAAGAPAPAVCPTATAVYFGNGINKTAIDTDAVIRDVLPALAQESGIETPTKYATAYNQTNGVFSDIIETLEQKAAEDSRFTWFVMNNIVSYLVRGANVPTPILNSLPGSDAFVALLQQLINEAIADSAGQSTAFYNADVAKHVDAYAADLTQGYRVILVAHSQGNLYANAARARLLTTRPSGIGSFAIASVATPAETASDGYVTSDSDSVIGLLRKLGKTVLPSNVHVPITTDDFLGHGFEEIYLNASLPARARIVSLLSGIANQLPPPSGSCAIPDAGVDASDADSDGGTDAAAADAGPMQLAAPGQSCAGGLTCAGGIDCCQSIVVPGGTFPMGERPEHSATVASFALDKFAVTVGRMRAFVNAYKPLSATPPPAGAGAHPLIAGSGWDSKWDSFFPPGQAAMKHNLNCSLPNQTWTDAAGTNESLPINCVNWYEAFTFCVWDGGRLPTEAEWEYAAAGGDENRVYPWGSAQPGVDTNLAVWGCLWNNIPGTCGPWDIAPVGSIPAGDGRWGHSDLAGNMWQLIFDYYDQAWYYNEGAVCVNCANLTTNIDGRVLRGGWFGGSQAQLHSAYRNPSGTPASRNDAAGFRCARTP